MPADVITQVAREFAAADGAAAYGRIGVSTQEFGLVCQWAVQLLNLVTGNTDRVGGTLLTSPAIDAIGRGLLGRGHFDKHRSRVRQAPEFAGELPVVGAARGDRDPGRGPGPGAADPRRQPGAVDARRRGARPGDRGARLLCGRGLLHQRDHPAGRRDPAADEPPRARPLRPGLPPAGGARHRAVHARGVPEEPRPAARLGDLPRDQRPGDPAAAAEAVARAAAQEVRPPRRSAPPSSSRPCSAPGGPASPSPSSGSTPRASTSVRCGRASCPPGCSPRTSGSQPAPALVVGDLERLRGQELPADDELVLIGRRHQRDCNSWMHNTTRLTKGRPRHQLLMHPDDLAARGLTDGSTVKVTSRVGTVEGRRAGDRRHDARGGLPPPRLRPPGATGPGSAWPTRSSARRSTTSPTRSGSTLSGNAALSGVPVTVR